MPLPLIPVVLGGLAIASAAFGAKKGIDAYNDNNEAESINEIAENRIDKAKNSLEEARKATEKSLENCGEQKIYTLDNVVKNFVQSFEKIKNVEITESSGLDEISKLQSEQAQIRQHKEMSLKVSSMLAGGIGGIGTGALAAFGAYGATMTFGAASTGTAIASLSGVAATNATLAFLGGGSLAAGGLGMAGGMAVLGGVVAGPALAVMGLVASSAAEKKLDEAYSNLAKSRKIAEELKNMKIATDAIARRTKMFVRLLIRTNCAFSNAIEDMQSVIETQGIDYSAYNDEARKIIAQNIQYAQITKAILDTPILNEDGALSTESKILLESNGLKV